jgi:polysaccharide pyruvyl transferase WcaK-like protein
MRILVDHGSAYNLGDIGMIESVVCRLRRLLPRAEFYVVERPRMRTGIWSLPRVFPQAPYTLRAFLPELLGRAPFFWRYQVECRRITRRLELASLGKLRRAGSLSLRPQDKTQVQSKTLHDFCAEFDGLHVVGGGNLTDVFWPALYHRCCLIMAFEEQGKPVVLTGQQLGPFTSWMSKRGLVRALRNVNFLGVREAGGSLSFCKETRLDPRRFEVMGDDSFGLAPAEPPLVDNVLAKYNLKAKGFLAANVRVARYSRVHADEVQKLAAIIDAVAGHFHMPVLVVPIAFNPGDSGVAAGRDLVSAMRSADAAVLNERNPTPGLAKGVLGRAFGALGVSYHFCTFALSQGIPAVCAYASEYYSQKASGLSDFWGDERLALALKSEDPIAAARQVIGVFEDPLVREKLRTQSDRAHAHWEEVFDREVGAFRELG